MQGEACDLTHSAKEARSLKDLNREGGVSETSLGSAEVALNLDF